MKINKAYHIIACCAIIAGLTGSLSPAWGASQPPATQQEILPKEDFGHDLRNRMDGGTTPRQELTGAIGTVDTESLMKYPDLNLINALQGHAAGLVIRQEGGSLGRGSSINIRGLHALTSNGAIVVVDGVERPMEDLLPEEIHSIEILKDAAAKVIYGPAAANGVVLITTRRGVMGAKTIWASAEFGFSPSAFTADYLDSYTYATLYNEARANDGLGAYYMPFQLEGYRKSTGPNDMLYPNVDYKDLLLRNSATFLKATFEVNGGTKNILYALNAGYVAGEGLENAGKRSRLDKLNLRANLDIGITDFLTVQADVAGRMWIQNRGVITGTDMFGMISTHRPNEYPLTVDPEAIGVVANEGGVPTFGGSTTYPDNLYADMKYGGNVNERYTTSQANLGIRFDFEKYVKGLTADAFVTLDNYNYLHQQLRNTYTTYDISPYLDATGAEQTRVTLLRLESLPKSNSISNSQLRRTFGWRANIGYKATFGDNSLAAMLAARYITEENKGMVQDRKQSVYSMRLNYDYGKRYFAEFILADMGNNKFDEGNRYYLSPVGSVAWMISNEEFLKHSRAVDYLKLKASYGVMGYGVSTGYSLWQTTWKEDGTIGFGENNSSNNYLIALVRAGNPDLKWETSEEINIGVEFSMLGNRLWGEMNYFNEHHRDIIAVDNRIYTDMLGDYAIARNVGETRNQGMDMSLNWSDTKNDFSYRVGVNFLYNKDKIIHDGQLENIEQGRVTVGKSSGTMYGLQALGLYGKDVPLAGSPTQSFGPYVNGDIAYADQNNDGVIDSRDMIKLGRNFPATVWGITADMRYRNWGLYIHATAETGASIWMNSTYFWNYGENKYSTLALDRYHPQNNPEGKYPRLTTLDGNNNYRNSSFWLQKADFLRLKNIEVSYTFDTLKKEGGSPEKIKVFARGTNVAVLTGVKDLDPEMPNAGVTTYPAYSTYTLGLTVTF